MTPVLLAAAVSGQDPPADLLSQVLGYGVLGIVVLLILFRFLVPGWVITRQDDAHQSEMTARDAAHQREVAAMQATIAQQDGEIAALRAGMDTSGAFIRDQVVPALTRSTDALVRSNDLARVHLHELARRAGTS